MPIDASFFDIFGMLKTVTTMTMMTTSMTFNKTMTRMVMAATTQTTQPWLKEVTFTATFGEDSALGFGTQGL